MCLALCGQEVCIMTAAVADSADNAFMISSAGHTDVLVKRVIRASVVERTQPTQSQYKHN